MVETLMAAVAIQSECICGSYDINARVVLNLSIRHLFLRNIKAGSELGRDGNYNC